MEHRFTAGELAKLSGLSKQTILFYDRKGVLKPDYINRENGYRYYNADQLDLLDNISMLKEIGLSLSEIKDFMEMRNRNTALALMETQQESIHRKIRNLQTIEKQLAWKINTLRDISGKQDGLFLKYHEKEELLVAEKVVYPKSRTSKNPEIPYDAVQALTAQNIAIKRLMTRAKQENYPYFYQQGVLIPMEEIQNGHFLKADCMFLPVEKYVKTALCLTKPVGLYAHYYFTGNYTNTGAAYKYLLEKLKEMNLEPGKQVYEHIVIDSLAASEADKYVTLIQIPVCRTTP